LFVIVVVVFFLFFFSPTLLNDSVDSVILIESCTVSFVSVQCWELHVVFNNNCLDYHRLQTKQGIQQHKSKHGKTLSLNNCSCAQQSALHHSNNYNL